MLCLYWSSVWNGKPVPGRIPSNIYMAAGLFSVIYLNLAFGANNAIQPGTVILF